MKTLSTQFEVLEATLLKNIANHIFAYEFHATGTDQELEEYYGGAGTNRDALLRDTLHKMKSEQIQLTFLQTHKLRLEKAYGNENPTGDLGLALQRSTGVSVEPESRDTDDAEDEPKPSPYQGDGSADDAPEGDNRSGQA